DATGVGEDVTDATGTGGPGGPAGDSRGWRNTGGMTARSGLSTFAATMVTHSSTVATTITPVTSSHRPTPTTGCPVPAPVGTASGCATGASGAAGVPRSPPLGGSGASSRSAVVICFLAAANTSPGGRVPGPPETDDGRVVGRIGRTAGHVWRTADRRAPPRPVRPARGGSPAATAVPGPAPRRPAGRRAGASRTPSHAGACANSPTGVA